MSPTVTPSAPLVAEEGRSGFTRNAEHKGRRVVESHPHSHKEIFMQKLLFVVAATVVVAATPASAQWRDYYGWDGPRVGSFGADAYADGRGYVVRRHHRGYV